MVPITKGRSVRKFATWVKNSNQLESTRINSINSSTHQLKSTHLASSLDRFTVGQFWKHVSTGLRYLVGSSARNRSLRAEPFMFEVNRTYFPSGENFAKG